MDVSYHGTQPYQACCLVRTVVEGVPVVFEDAHVIIVNKPPGLLSQPGRLIADSVSTRVIDACKDASGPMLVHRLDMDTSGLMMLAKNRDAHRVLSLQFEKREIGKRYRAVVQRPIIGLGGRIHAPLRLDLDNRPTQIICYQHGKKATTVWHADPLGGPNSVVLYPLTGRSHQLRVHMADPAGLGIPIKGDRLYGGATHESTVDRMYLHADLLAFNHPGTGMRTRVQCPAPFMSQLE